MASRDLAALETVELSDSRRVEITAMHRTDGGRLERFHHALSPETTRLRFFTIHPELSASELYRFTHVDHVDREALVALAGDEIVGVARFDRAAGGISAEVAFVVADSWQGIGLGKALFRALAETARRVGIRRFDADTLPENHRMLAVFRASGLPVRSRFVDGLVHVEIDLD